MSLSLKGQKALAMGASSGIGEAVAISTNQPETRQKYFGGTVQSSANVELGKLPPVSQENL